MKKLIGLVLLAALAGCSNSDDAKMISACESVIRKMAVDPAGISVNSSSVITAAPEERTACPYPSRAAVWLHFGAGSFFGPKATIDSASRLYSGRPVRRAAGRLRAGAGQPRAGVLDDRPRRRQFRRTGPADEQHGENQHMQGHGQDRWPEVAFRLRALELVHQLPGASVIRPTLPTPAFCRPPMTAMTEP